MQCRPAPNDVNKMLEFESTEEDVNKLANPVKLELTAQATWIASEGKLFLQVTGNDRFQCLKHRELRLTLKIVKDVFCSTRGLINKWKRRFSFGSGDWRTKHVTGQH